MPTIKVNDKSIDVSEGEVLRTALISNGHGIKSPCGGSASCGQCVVVIKSGEDNLSEFSFEERQILGNVFHITKERLSCQTKVFGDVEVDISIHEEEEKKSNAKVVVRKKDQIPEKVMVERPPREGGYRRPKQFRENKDYKDKK